MGLWFYHRDIHRWTWLSHDGTTKKEIDQLKKRQGPLQDQSRLLQPGMPREQWPHACYHGIRCQTYKAENVQNSTVNILNAWPKIPYVRVYSRWPTTFYLGSKILRCQSRLVHIPIMQLWAWMATTISVWHQAFTCGHGQAVMLWPLLAMQWWWWNYDVLLLRDILKTNFWITFVDTDVFC